MATDIKGDVSIGEESSALEVDNPPGNGSRRLNRIDGSAQSHRGS